MPQATEQIEMPTNGVEVRSTIDNGGCIATARSITLFDQSLNKKTRSIQRQAMLRTTQSISKETKGPSTPTSTDTKQRNLLVGARRNVFSVVFPFLLGWITNFLFYSNSYTNMASSASLLSAKESFGWFDDIPDEGWQLMKLRARTAVQYMHPSTPELGGADPIMWYLNNLQVSRPLSCRPSHTRTRIQGQVYSSDVCVMVSLTRNIPIFCFSLISHALMYVVSEDTATVPSGCATLTVC
jgi:hypothetical protein